CTLKHSHTHTHSHKHTHRHPHTHTHTHTLTHSCGVTDRSCSMCEEDLSESTNGVVCFKCKTAVASDSLACHLPYQDRWAPRPPPPSLSLSLSLSLCVCVSN